jgi:glycosyltransferase involved in cell wall biosynthesis
VVGEAGRVTVHRDTLVEALQQLLADPARVRALGERARRRILEEFVDAAVARRTAGFWEKVLERVPASPAAR